MFDHGDLYGAFAAMEVSRRQTYADHLREAETESCSNQHLKEAEDILGCLVFPRLMVLRCDIDDDGNDLYAYNRRINAPALEWVGITLPTSCCFNELCGLVSPNVLNSLFEGFSASFPSLEYVHIAGSTYKSAYTEPFATFREKNPQVTLEI